MGASSYLVLEILESKFKIKVKATPDGLHWLELYDKTDANTLRYKCVINKKEYDTLRGWFI